jgi:protein involved in polysaccharide export with SLBB domain
MNAPFEKIVGVTILIWVSTQLVNLPRAAAQIIYQPIPHVPADQLRPSCRRGAETSPVDAALLRNRPARNYFLDADDVLGVFIEGVLGSVGESPPIQLPGPRSDLPPSLGYPVVVRADGTISLPLVEPVSVVGLTVTQVEQRIKSIYLDAQRPIVKPEHRIIVTLMRKRTIGVYVVRGDQSQAGTFPQTRSSAVNQRTDQSHRSQRLQLPAGDNDLLNALSQTGGLPGVNARSDVKIYRSSRGLTQSSVHSGGGYHGSATIRPRASSFPRTQIGGTAYFDGNTFGDVTQWRRSNSRGHSSGSVTTVPTRRRFNESVVIAPVDTRLDQGDVVVIEARDTEVYYTGGLLGGGEFPLPRDRGIDVLEAIAVAGQSFGARSQNRLGGIPTAAPTELLILRRQPGGGQITIGVELNRALADPSQRIQVRAGDVLILRHTRWQQLQNAGSSVFNTLGVGQILGR